MVKTTIYLPEQTKRRLARAAARHHCSESELIRYAIDRLLRDEPPERRPTLGIFDSGDPTFAERADELLTEGLEGAADPRRPRMDQALGAVQADIRRT